MRGFKKETLTPQEIAKLEELGRIVRGDILKMTTLANSGHPAGSMSSADIYLVVYSYANIDPKNPDWEDRDRIIVSHGHTSPGVYAVLGRLGFFDIDDAIAYFRLAGSPFEGHIEREVPGVEWTTGNLGQGLSAGCGFALASKILNKNFHVYVLMSDAEQAKGQLAEARRFARKFNLNNITVIIDYNRRQISGKTYEVMPVNIIENYISDGWYVMEVDGHNYRELYEAIVQSHKIEEAPVAIIAHTVMGKGVTFMEGDEKYHGKPLTEEQYKLAIKELGVSDDLDKYKKIRESKKFPEFQRKFYYEIKIESGNPIVYGSDKKIATRNAFGNALKDITILNCRNNESTPIAVLDCDLAGSVKVDGFAAICPERFFETGVQEHNAVTVAGALSSQGIISIFADFGVFGIDETYNQHRLNDINHTNLKLVVTHLGIDVGEDGKTHHCVDYIGVIRNLYGFKLIIPADANQADKVTRYIISHFGNYVLGLGRSSWPIITKEDGSPYFDENYSFTYGKIDVLREGNDGTLIVYGSTAHKGIKVHEILKDSDINLKLINISSPFELEEEILANLPGKHVFVYEDHNVYSGLGVIVSNYFASRGIQKIVHKFGLKNYSPSGKHSDLFNILGLSPEKIAEKIKELMI